MSTETQETQGSTPRYQMLDVWRGVVSLVVVLEHVGVSLWFLPEGASSWTVGFQKVVVTALKWNVGTPLFFVMSGYCIAASLLSSRRRGENPLHFLGRRLWRIFPTYWVALLGFVALALALDVAGLSRYHYNDLSQGIRSPADLKLAQWLGNLTLTETWRPLVGGGESWVFTRVAWSLCYQEQFYVICVLALWVAPKRLGRALAVVTGMILLFRLAAWDSGRLPHISGLFPVYWHEFAVGLAVYWRLTGAGAATFASRRALELFVAGLLVIACVCGTVSTIAACGFGLLLMGLYRWDHLAVDAAWLAPIRACGKRSYSIYLTHLPVAAAGNQLLSEMGLTGFWWRALVMVPLVTAASIAAGWAFHSLVERRFMALPQFPLTGARVGKRPCVAALSA